MVCSLPMIRRKVSEATLDPVYPWDSSNHNAPPKAWGHLPRRERPSSLIHECLLQLKVY
jgi:hypothetical protein